MKYSIIIPSWNNANFLFPCIDSVIKNTANYEIIVVLNGCTDSSVSLLNNLHSTYPNIHFLNVYDRICFSEAVNYGFSKCQGENIILLNDDTLVTPNWADQLFSCIAASEKFYNVHRVGAVGPLSNNAGGMQGVEHDQVNISSLDADSADFHNRYLNSSILAGFLSGFCLLITRECFNDVGSWDPKYLIGGWEDNDFSLRAYQKGWKFVIDRSTFVFHHGQKSLSRIKNSYDLRFRLNQIYFYEKFFSDKPQKLTVLSRIHNGMPYLPDFIENIKGFADDLIVVCDRCTDGSAKYIKESGFPCIIQSFNDKYDEYRDRQWLVSAAAENHSDWILSLDVDELMDDTFNRDSVRFLTHPVNSETQAYIFNFKNFWINRSFFRTDGVFGHMTGLRMARVIPETNIKSPFEHGLHCSHIPLTPYDYTRSVRFSINHLGYNTPEKRSSKFSFYTSLDKKPDIHAVGPEGYNHLISTSVSLREFKPNITLGLSMIVKDDEINLFSFLSKFHHFFDQIVVIDTGSAQFPEHICKIFSAELYKFEGKFDFSSARNFSKSKMNTSWILSMDCDEEINLPSFPLLFDLLSDSPDAYLFQVANIMPDNTIGYSDNVRLFRNIPEIYFSGMVHENVSKSISAAKLNYGLAPVTIQHFGYLKPKEIQDKKSILYEKLLLAEIKKHPKDAINHFHYAFFHFERKNPEAGIKELELSLRLQPHFFLSQKELGLFYLQKALSYFKDFAADVPPNHFFKPWSEEIYSKLDSAMHLNPGKLI